MIRLRVPGKMLLSGEYAVLEPGSQALGLALQRYVSVQAGPSQHWQLKSQLHTEALSWDAELKGPEILARLPEALHLVGRCIALAQEYFGELLPLEIEIHSDLQLHGIKLGLGSSAAVCLGILGALFAHQNQDLSSETTRLRLFKLGLLAHRQHQGNGSGSDLATCLWGSVCAYTPPDFDAVPWHQALRPLIDTSPWPLLQIQRLDWPSEWKLHFGWTGQAAYSKEFVNWYADWRKHEAEASENFLFQSSSAQLGLKAALEEGKQELFIQGLQRCRRVLQQLNEALPVAPETPELEALAQAAEKLGGAGKLSGAGGGDCGLAMVPSGQEQDLQQAWQLAGIQSLPLELDFEGLRLL